MWKNAEFRIGTKKKLNVIFKYMRKYMIFSFDFKQPKSDLKTKELEDFFCELNNLKLHERHMDLNEDACGKVR